MCKFAKKACKTYGCTNCREDGEGMPEFHVENLPTKFMEHLAELHVANDGKCPLCDIVIESMEENDFLKAKPIPWMVEKNIPRCIWALGKYIMDTHDIEPVAMDRHNRVADKCYKGGNAKLEDILYQRRCRRFYCTQNVHKVFQIIRDDLLETFGICTYCLGDGGVVLIMQAMDIYKYSVVNEEYHFDKIERKHEPIGFGTLNQLKFIKLGKIRPIDEIPLRPIDEIMKEFANEKTKKQKSMKKKGKRSVPQKRTKPRILRTSKNCTKKEEKVDDDQSVKSNRYHKRFTKTKKPARL